MDTKYASALGMYNTCLHRLVIPFQTALWRFIARNKRLRIPNHLKILREERVVDHPLRQKADDS